MPGSSSPIADVEPPYRPFLHPVTWIVAIAGARAHPIAGSPHVPMAVPLPVAIHPHPARARRRYRFVHRRGWTEIDTDTHADMCGGSGWRDRESAGSQTREQYGAENLMTHMTSIMTTVRPHAPKRAAARAVDGARSRVQRRVGDVVVIVAQ